VKISTKQYVDNQIQWVMDLKQKESDWLKIYVDAELRAVREAVNKVETTSAQAVSKSEENNRLKFEAQNEWRQQFKDQQSGFVTKREFWAGILAVVLALLAVYFRK